MDSVLHHGLLAPIIPDNAGFQDTVTLYRFKQDESFVSSQGSGATRASVSLENIGVCALVQFYTHREHNNRFSMTASHQARYIFFLQDLALQILQLMVACISLPDPFKLMMLKRWSSLLMLNLSKPLVKRRLCICSTNASRHVHFTFRACSFSTQQF